LLAFLSFAVGRTPSLDSPLITSNHKPNATGILRQLTGVLVPAEAPVPGRPGEVIKHQYLHIR